MRIAVDIDDCPRYSRHKFEKMSTGKKHRKQRKHRPSPVKSQISIRLEKLRNRRRHNLWSDDDDGERSTPSNVIVLSDSDKDEQSTRKRKSRSHTDKNATCLICSIVSSLSSKNCCPEHLSRLKRHSHRLSEHVTIQASANEGRRSDLDVQQASPMTVDLIESTSPTRSPLPPLASTSAIEFTSRKSPEHPPPPIDDVCSQTTSDKPLHDPWTPTAEEIVTALEQVVDEDDTPPATDSPLEYTPTTARRTKTGIMATRLPKISLKPGRFRHGRPISDPSTSNNGANEYRPLASTTQSPPNYVHSHCIRPPSPSPPQNSENPSDNVFTQDEPSATSQTNERTPSRISYRLNPDGIRVSKSRPSLLTNAHSPLLNALRRTSTDVTPFSKQM